MEILGKVLELLNEGAIDEAVEGHDGMFKDYKNYKVFFRLPSDRDVGRFVEQANRKCFTKKENGEGISDIKVVSGGDEVSEVIGKLTLGSDLAVEDFIYRFEDNFGVKLMHEKI